MHSSSQTSSKRSNKAAVAVASVPVLQLCRDTVVVRAVLRSVRHRVEQTLMVRMPVVVLGHLGDLQTPGENRLPVEHLELLARVLWVLWGNCLPRTVGGLDRSPGRDLRLLVCVRVRGLAGTLGLGTFGYRAPHRSH
jgi:hypothetical protein